MNATELTRSLILGSQNIDRMRSEIQQVVSMVSSMIRQVYCKSGGRMRVEYEAAGPVMERGYHLRDGRLRFFYWKIQLFGSASNLGVVIDLRSVTAGKDETEVEDVEHRTIPMHLVSDAYKILPYLVEEISERIPEVRKICQPILDAAEVEL